MGSRSTNAKRNMFTGIMSSFITALFGFFTRTVLIYTLGERYVGIMSVFSSILSVLNMTELGFSSAIIVNLYKPLERNDIKSVCEILNYYKTIYKLIGSIIFVVGIGMMPFLNFFVKEAFSENIYVIYAICLLDTSVSYLLFSYKGALLNAIQRFDIVKIIYTVSSVLKGVIQIIAVVWMRNFYLYVIASIIATIVNNLLLQYMSVKKYPFYLSEGKIESNKKQGIKRQVMGLSIGKLAETARNSFDNIVISWYMGLSVTAIYNNYFYIYNVVIGFMWILMNAIQASVGNSIASESVEKNYNDLRKIELIFGYCISVSTSLMLCLYQPFMEIWTNGRLLLPEKDMVLFVIYFYCIAINGPRNLYFQGLGLWWEVRTYALLEAVGNLLLNLLFGRFMGVTGILIATILTIIFFNYFCISTILFRKYFKKSPKDFFVDRGYYTIVTVVVCVSAYLICCAINVNGIAGLIVRMVISSGIAMIGCFAYYAVFKRQLLIEALNLLKVMRHR